MFTKSDFVDPRVQRTRQLLHRAFQELVLEQDVGSITVQDITRRAAVNRGTFYLHYRDKNDLLTDMVEVLIDYITGEREHYFASVAMLTSNKPPKFIVHLFESFGHQADFYRRLLDDSGSIKFRARLVQYLEQTIFEALPTELPVTQMRNVPASLVSHYFAATIIEVVAWWLVQGQSYTSVQAAGWCWQIIALAIIPPEPDQSQTPSTQ